jgi:hypothetical protein
MHGLKRLHCASHLWRKRRNESWRGHERSTTRAQRRSALLRRKRASGGVGGGTSARRRVRRMCSTAAEAGERGGWRGHERRECEGGARSTAAEKGSLSERKERRLLLRRERARSAKEVLYCGGRKRAASECGGRALLRRAASLGDCRGETPRTPPAAGEVAHVLGRTCARPHMSSAAHALRSAAHALGRTCARPHMCARPHWCRREWGGSI